LGRDPLRSFAPSAAAATVAARRSVDDSGTETKVLMSVGENR
jgi:hypothetical protein